MSVLDEIGRAAELLNANGVSIQFVALLTEDQAARLYDEVHIHLRPRVFTSSKRVKAEHIHNGVCWQTKIYVEGMK